MNAHLMFAAHVETRMDEPCPATQDAIDRLVSAEGFRGRVGMLAAIRDGYFGDPRANFCASLLSAWKERDILLASGRTRDFWLAALTT